MCIICRKEYNNDISEINISGCREIREIPMLPELQILYCSKCSNLQKIPILPKLRELDCSICLGLQEIPVLPRLIKLRCAGCMFLREIPLIPLLQELDCSICRSLQEIPVLPRLDYLKCSGSPIRTIPFMPKLEMITCTGCSELREIPVLPRLKILWCEDCSNLVIQPNKLLAFGYKHENCHWLKEDTIQKIVLIQRYIRKYSKYHRFCIYTSSPCYSAWLYAPDGPLGRKHLKRLERMIWTKKTSIKTDLNE